MQTHLLKDVELGELEGLFLVTKGIRFVGCLGDVLPPRVLVE